MDDCARQRRDLWLDQEAAQAGEDSHKWTDETLLLRSVDGDHAASRIELPDNFGRLVCQDMMTWLRFVIFKMIATDLQERAVRSVLASPLDSQTSCKDRCAENRSN